MSEYNEGLLVVAVYVFVATAFTLPFVVGYLFYRISKVIARAIRVLTYIEDGEEESRKYHE